MTMTEPEVTADGAPAVEVVKQADVPSTDLAPAQSPMHSAIEAAAQAAIDNPGIPGRDEFLMLAVQARMLSMSGAAPPLVRNNPHLAFHVAMIGRDLGISPSAALNLIDVLDTKNGPQLSLSPQLLNGQLRRLGLGEILKKVEDFEHVVATAVGPAGIDRRCRLTWRQDVHVEDCDCDILGESVFTWEDAQIANLVGKGCTATAHKDSCKCGFGWKNWPKRLMWWRASGFGADDYFPEASLGMYSAEALGAVVDEDGRALDPATIELPEGYEPAAPPPPTQADIDAHYDAGLALQVAILALPDAQRADLRERWKGHDKLKGFRPDQLNLEGIRLAASLVRGFEAAARRDAKGEWSQDEAQMGVMRTLSGVVGALLAYPVGLPAGSPDPGPGPTEPPSGAQDGEAAPEAPQEAPGAAQAEPGEDPTAAFREQLTGATDAQVDEAIAKVRELGEIRYVDRELTRLRQNALGTPAERRRRLGLALVYEALHDAPPPEQIP